MARSRGRLTRSDDFARAYQAGRSVANKYLVLYYFERSTTDTSEGASGPRVGFSVSKRLGNAVERNRVKRLLREAFRMNSGMVEGDMDLVLVARTPAVQLAEADGLKALEDKVGELLRRISLQRQGERRRPAS